MEEIPMTELRDRPENGAEDIEITPQMIEAGTDAYWNHDPDYVESDKIVREIFIAMMRLSKQISSQSP
jgi:hypothetical protein